MLKLVETRFLQAWTPTGGLKGRFGVCCLWGEDMVN